LGALLTHIATGGRARCWLVALLLLCGAGLFVNRALENADRVNTDMGRTDQKAYIDYAESLAESHGTFVGARNRMPVYPFLLSSQRDLKQSDEEFFAKAKRFSIALTVVAIALVAAVFLLSFPLHAALNLIFFSAFYVFLFRAAYVQAEVSYYLLAFLAFFAVWRLFARPSWLWALAGGALLGLSHLTKASVLPGVLVFVVFYIADALWSMTRKQGMKVSLRRIAIAVVVVAAFLVTVFPYIKKSKEIYGHYFYNVNSTFYFWCDSWDEAKERTRAAGDRGGWPDIPPDQIPSATNYLRTHTPEQILHRVVDGLWNLNGITIRSYGYYPLVLIYAIFALLLIGWRWRLCWRLFLRRPMPVLALLTLFSGYLVLSAWYTQIISGNRIVLSLFLPLIFTLTAIIVFLGRGKALPIGSRKVPVLPLFQLVVSCYLVIDIFLICSNRILRMYGGS
jgi:hypothetical protein